MADENTQAGIENTQTATPNDAAAEDARAEAAFSAGFDAGTPKKPEPAGPKANGRAQPAEAPREAGSNGQTAPEYVQISKTEWADVVAAAKKTAGYDQQLSKAFGTIGNLQKVINGLRDQTPKGRPIEISRDAFKDLERDFPELANSTRSALERALAGVTGNAPDPAAIRRMLSEHQTEREVEILEDAHPDWRDIVGAVDVTQQMPDANNPFRKWLSGKDQAYQRRINGTDSAAVVMRAIDLFQRETKTRPTPAATANGGQPNPVQNARASRIREAVQPRGDGAPPAAGNSEEDAFAAGFHAR